MPSPLLALSAEARFQNPYAKGERVCFGTLSCAAVKVEINKVHQRVCHDTFLIQPWCGQLKIHLFTGGTHAMRMSPCPLKRPPKNRNLFIIWHPLLDKILNKQRVKAAIMRLSANRSRGEMENYVRGDFDPLSHEPRSFVCVCRVFIRDDWLRSRTLRAPRFHRLGCRTGSGVPKRRI